MSDEKQPPSEENPMRYIAVPLPGDPVVEKDPNDSTKIWMRMPIKLVPTEEFYRKQDIRDIHDHVGLNSMTLTTLLVLAPRIYQGARLLRLEAGLRNIGYAFGLKRYAMKDGDSGPKDFESITTEKGEIMLRYFEKMVANNVPLIPEHDEPRQIALHWGLHCLMSSLNPEFPIPENDPFYFPKKMDAPDALYSLRIEWIHQGCIYEKVRALQAKSINTLLDELSYLKKPMAKTIVERTITLDHHLNYPGKAGEMLLDILLFCVFAVELENYMFYQKLYDRMPAEFQSKLPHPLEVVRGE